MKSRPILAALLSILALCQPSAAEAQQKPNVLIIVADDLGFSDTGCYGSEIQTPNLDKLAANGLRFTQFYNTARCWSSRASILTGYYAQAVRRDKITGMESEGGVMGIRPRWAMLLPQYLKPLDYHSYHSGKWHLDGTGAAGGFEHSYISGGGKGYFDPSGTIEDDVVVPPAKDKEGYYSTVAIADHAIKYLKQHAAKYPDKPFFQYLAFHSPHFPLHALPEDIAIYKDRYKAGWDTLRMERLAKLNKNGIVDCALSRPEPNIIPDWNLPEAALQKRIGPDEVGHAVPWDTLTEGQKEFQAAKMAVHAAMIHRMDIEIGRVLDQIRSMGGLENTAVFFVSDNGASAEQIIRGLGEDPAAPIGSEKSYLGMGPGWSSAANTPFRLHKSWNHEGGIATPLIVSWPAGIKARNELRTDPGHVIDLVPTILEITGGKQPAAPAGLPAPPMQGMSLVPAFTTNGAVKHEYLWWNHIGNRAVRVGDWKLVAAGKSPWELYDLAKDRSETKNLASANPEKVKELERAWTKGAQDCLALAQQDPAPESKKRKKKSKATTDKEE